VALSSTAVADEAFPLKVTFYQLGSYQLIPKLESNFVAAMGKICS